MCLVKWRTWSTPPNNINFLSFYSFLSASFDFTAYMINWLQSCHMWQDQHVFTFLVYYYGCLFNRKCIHSKLKKLMRIILSWTCFNYPNKLVNNTHHRNNIIGEKFINKIVVVRHTSLANVVGISSWQNTRPADGESVVSQLKL